MNTFKRSLAAWAALLCVLSVMLTGCSGSRESQLIGDWEVRDGSASGANIKAFDNQDPGALHSALATMAHQDLSLKDDKTFVMSGTQNAQGTWSFDAESGALTLTPSAGAAGTGVIKMQLSEGNQQLSFPNPTGQGAAVVLQKKDQ